MTPEQEADMDFQPQVSQQTQAAGPHFHTIQLSTGVHMHYAEYGDPSGEPILFLHGFTDSWFSYSEVVKYLNPRHRLFLLDQRGHGNSSQGERYQMSDLAQDVVAFIRTMGLQRVTLVGHSMGSFVAAHVAVMASEAIVRLVLLGSAVNAFTDELGAFSDLINTLEDPISETFAREFQVSTLYQPIPDEFLDCAVAMSMKVAASTWRMALAGQIHPEQLPSYDQIHVPTLIIWGDHDAIWPYTEQEKLLARIPHAELKVYPETGHALHWERPEQFARDLEVFITRTPQA
jgi:non-heme chloroperoxidase